MDGRPLSNLIRLGSGPEVYLVTQGNIIKHIPSVEIANKYHLDLDTVISVSQTEFEWYRKEEEMG